MYPEDVCRGTLRAVGGNLEAAVNRLFDGNPAPPLPKAGTTQSVVAVPSSVNSGDPIYRIYGAGAAEVNGIYYRSVAVDGVSSYENESGICLLRYRMKSGSVYWYFTTKGGNLDQESGDYYRCETETDAPPLGEIHGSEGVFETNKCPSGVLPSPQITLVSQEESDELAAAEAASIQDATVTSDISTPNISALNLDEGAQDKKEERKASLISAFRPTQGY